MSLRPLVLDGPTRERIAAVKALAQEHPMPFEELQRRAREMDPVGDEPANVVDIPFGYRAVYSMEHQPNLGLSHHLSVSVGSRKRLPNQAAVLAIMEAFGMKPDFYRSVIWVENNQAINVVQAAERTPA